MAWSDWDPRNLQGAFKWARESAVMPPAAPPGAPPVGPMDAPAPGSGDDVSASGGARVLTWILLIVGLLAVLWWHEDKSKAFIPAAGLSVFAGFYVAAQAIERLLEILPPGGGTKQSKANRAVIFGALGFLLAIIAAESMHLYFVSAVGAMDVNANLDVLITALAIGGGTKPLHDAIKRIEKAKETPPVTT
jgi:hypothetical protein